jgi:DNA-binding HxlR family transcriptional regulator
MVRFRILERTSFGDVPPRVEYRLTQFGLRFIRLLDDIEELQGSLVAKQAPRVGKSR